MKEIQFAIFGIRRGHVVRENTVFKEHPEICVVCHAARENEPVLWIRHGCGIRSAGTPFDYPKYDVSAKDFGDGFYVKARVGKSGPVKIFPVTIDEGF